MRLLFLFISFALFSCGTQKNTDLITNDGQNGQTTGIVVVSDTCTYIKAIVDGNDVTMYPINLEDKFKKADLEIVFDYALSRGPQPTNCVVDKVISISNVHLLEL